MATKKDRSSAVAVTGLSETVAALKRVDADAAKGLRKELAEIAGVVRTSARSYVTNKTGRHYGQRLGPSIRSGANAKGASVYSNAPQAVSQDVGGRVGRGGKTVLKRSDVSNYMSKGVASSHDEVDRLLDRFIDDLERDFGSR